MITIIADPHSYRPVSENALLLNEPEDYISARIAVRRALNEGRHLTLHVTNILPLHWLGDLKGYEGVEWVCATPEMDFRRIFGVDPSPPFSTEILVNLELASIPEPPPGSDPVAWILRHRIDPVWSYTHGSSNHLAQLLSWALHSEHNLPHYLYPLAQQRLSIWANDYLGYAVLRVGSLVSDACGLIRRWALQRYDPVWLQEQGLLDLPILSVALSNQVCIQALKGLTPAIDRYWRQRMAQQSIDLEFLHHTIEQMSGWSDAEIRIVESIIRYNPTLPDQQLLLALRRRFGDLPSAAVTLAELEAHVQPPLPALPQEEWDDEQWLRWATSDYLPYFLWTVRTGQSREYQQQCALRYEDWLVQRYPSWLCAVTSPLLLRQFTLLQDILNATQSTVVVWLVIDGMTWWQGRMFWEICRNEGLFAQRYEVGVALLPSLTTISKRALVTGMPVMTESRVSIAQAAHEKLTRLGVSNYVGYDSRELLSVLRSAEAPKCLVWFANTLDRLAHERTEVADDGPVRGYLEELAKGLAKMQEICFERGFAFQALVGSDHGSTLLPIDSSTRRLPQATHEVVDIWEDSGDQRVASPASARAATLSEGLSLTPDQLTDWHILDRQVYQLPHDYLIPRGYTAVNRRPTGWTHGGLTPEETIVPLLHFASEPLVVEPLELSLTGQARPKQESELSLKLVNANPVPFDEVIIQIADFAPVTINRVSSTGHCEILIMLPARVIEGTQLLLPWELQATILGVEHRQQGEVTIAVRRLQTEDSFDDLFG